MQGELLVHKVQQSGDLRAIASFGPVKSLRPSTIKMDRFYGADEVVGTKRNLVGSSSGKNTEILEISLIKYN
jgi:hypothetical protein